METLPHVQVSSDEQAALLAAAQRGDASACDRLFAQHRRFVEGYLWRRVRSVDDREDLVQTVLLRAARNIAAFRGDCPFSSWLLRIAANALHSYYERVLARSQAVVSIDAAAEAGDPLPQPNAHEPSPFERVDSRMMVESLVAAARVACSADERRVITMFYQGRSFEEIALLLDMKGATVRSHFLRGRRKLLAHLIRSRSSLIGGDEGVKTAVRKALEDATDDCRLSRAEVEALGSGNGSEELYRTACMKVARFLETPMTLLGVVVLWRMTWT